MPCINIVITAYDHTLCGIGIVVAGIIGKAGADINIGAAVSILNAGVGV